MSSHQEDAELRPGSQQGSERARNGPSGNAAATADATPFADADYHRTAAQRPAHPLEASTRDSADSGLQAGTSAVLSAAKQSADCAGTPLTSAAPAAQRPDTARADQPPSSLPTSFRDCRDGHRTAAGHTWVDDSLTAPPATHGHDHDPARHSSPQAHHEAIRLGSDAQQDMASMPQHKSRRLSTSQSDQREQHQSQHDTAVPSAEQHAAKQSSESGPSRPDHSVTSCKPAADDPNQRSQGHACTAADQHRRASSGMMAPMHLCIEKHLLHCIPPCCCLCALAPSTEHTSWRLFWLIAFVMLPGNGANNRAVMQVMPQM